MPEGISLLISPQLLEVITPAKRLDRFAFCERAKNAFAIVMTGETARYGNIILVKGVTRV